MPISIIKNDGYEVTKDPTVPANIKYGIKSYNNPNPINE